MAHYYSDFHTQVYFVSPLNKPITFVNLNKINISLRNNREILYLIIKTVFIP